MAKKSKKLTESGMLADIIIQGISEKKGQEIVSLNLKNIHHAVADYFVICQGNSRTQVSAIADSIYYEVKKATGISPWQSEGFANAEWIILDYGDVVAHIFQTEARSFYQLEQLWADAEIIKIEDQLKTK